MSDSNANTKSSKKFKFMSNPTIERLQKIVGTEESQTCVSYGGVVRKTIYFLIWTVIGVIAFFVINNYLLTVMPETMTVFESENVFEFSLTVPSIGAVGIAALIAVITAIISVFAHGGVVAVTGSLYAIAEGYLLAFITGSLKQEYEWMGMLALVLTIVIVLTLLGLYSSGKIRVGHKFRTVMSAIFITLIISAGIMLVLNLVPVFRPVAAALAEIRANPIMSIIFSVIFVIIACLLLISDFDNVRMLVDNQLPKKYEWDCAFGIAYTVLYLYIELLELIVSLFGGSSNN